MTETRCCAGCGAVVPGRVGRCPSCGTWAGRDVVAKRAVMALAAVIAASVVVWAVRHGTARSAVMRVRVTLTGFLLSRDAKGTDVSATIDNPNPVPVSLKIRIRGYDITDRVCLEETIGPFRRIPPGVPYPIDVHLGTTPLKSVDVEAVDVQPVETAGR